MGSEKEDTMRAEFLRPAQDAIHTGSSAASLPLYVRDMMPLSDRQIEFVTRFQKLVGEHQWPSQFALDRVGRAAIEAQRIRSIIEDCREK
jgi:hypothetical protein